MRVHKNQKQKQKKFSIVCENVNLSTTMRIGMGVPHEIINNSTIYSTAGYSTKGIKGSIQ
jgi:hypothetical protein